MDVIILLTNRDHFTDLWASIATISLICDFHRDHFTDLFHNISMELQAESDPLHSMFQQTYLEIHRHFGRRPNNWLMTMSPGTMPQKITTAPEAP